MDAGLKVEWMKALRSGEYKQGRDCLLNDSGAYCCLGVAAVVAGYQINSQHDRILRPDGSSSDLCSSYGTLEDFGLSGTARGHLIQMNDSGKTFGDIADWVEANL